MSKYPDPMEGRCTARVWASGDMDPCGDKAVVANRCLVHRDSEIASLQEANRTLRKKIAEHEARIQVLLGEEIRLEDSVALQATRI